MKKLVIAAGVILIGGGAAWHLMAGDGGMSEEDLIAALAARADQIEAANGERFDDFSQLASAVAVERQITIRGESFLAAGALSEGYLDNRRMQAARILCEDETGRATLVAGATLAAIFPETASEAIAEFIYHVVGQSLLEFNLLSYATIAEGSPEERLQLICDVIEGQVYPTLEAPADANVLGGRVASVGPYAAVEFIVVHDTGDLGLTTGRIVGIVPPSGPYVPIFIQRTSLDRLGITDVNALSGTFGGEILSSLSFQARRDETGEMVPF